MSTFIECCPRLKDDKIGFIRIVCCTVIEVVAVTSGWVFFDDAARTKQGLVQGRPPDHLISWLLAFTIIRTLTFLLGAPNICSDCSQSTPKIPPGIVDFLTIWVAEVPQIILSAVIVFCREEAISYPQLIKAAVTVFAAAVKVLSLCCCKSDKCCKSRWHILLHICNTVGLMVIFAFTILIFLFTQYERNPDGSINFKVPHSILPGKYDDEKYFKNVSVYFSHKIFDYHAPASSLEDVSLFRLATIYDLRQETFDRRMKIQYDSETSNNTKFVFWYGDSAGIYTAKECFQIDRAKKKLTLGSSCNAYIAGISSELIFSFHYIQPKFPGLIFGDIQYNVKLNQASTCSDFPNQLQEDIGKHTENAENPVIRYFQTKPHVNEDRHGILSTETEGQFYKITDLVDICEVWKIGFGRCQCTGRVSPHRETSLNVVCP